MAEVTMTLAEYLALLEGAGAIPPGAEERLGSKSMLKRKATISTPKRKGTALPGMKSALKKANAKARKKNGSFKKGWTQARVMKEAHRIRRRRR